MRKTSLMAAVIVLLSGCDTSLQKWYCLKGGGLGGLLIVDLDNKTVLLEYDYGGDDELLMITAINGGKVFMTNGDGTGILDRDQGTLTGSRGTELDCTRRYF